MSMNPWLMERMADYERDRIQRDIKQIRLEKEATQAGDVEEQTIKTNFPRRSLFMLIVSTLARFIPLQVYTRKTVGYGGITWSCRR